MKKLSLSLAAVAAVAAAITPALAMGDSAVEIDANGDGVLSMEEVQAVWSDVTAEEFAAMDTDADGVLNDSEIKAAEEAGMMKTDG